jgi:hypothetical protein
MRDTSKIPPLMAEVVVPFRAFGISAQTRQGLWRMRNTSKIPPLMAEVVVPLQSPGASSIAYQCLANHAHVDAEVPCREALQEYSLAELRTGRFPVAGKALLDQLLEMSVLGRCAVDHQAGVPSLDARTWLCHVLRHRSDTTPV